MKIEQLRIDLIKVMAARGLNQTAVGAHTGIGQSTINQLVTGKRSGLSGQSVLSLIPFVYDVNLKLPEQTDADRIP